MATEESDKQEPDKQETAKNLGVMFLCLVAGYGLAQYQNNKRTQNQLCYSRVSTDTSLPDAFADKVEEVIRAGGQAGIRRVGNLLELIVKTSTGDTQIFHDTLAGLQQVDDAFSGQPSAPSSQNTAQQNQNYADPMTGRSRGSRNNATVEHYDKDTDTWRTM
jgi:hypothetical protein